MKEALQQPRPGGHAAGQGHDGRAERRCWRRDARGEHTQDRLRRVHGPTTGTCSRRTRATSRSWSTRWSAGPPRPQRLLGLADRRAARRAGRADGAGAAGRRAGRARWPGCPSTACAPGGRSWTGGRPGDPMTGEQPLGMGDATTALAELADLAELEAELRQDYPGARLDDIDEAADPARARPPGRRRPGGAPADRARAGAAGLPAAATRGKLELTPKAVRRLGETALRRVFADLPERRPRRPRTARRRAGRRVRPAPPGAGSSATSSHRRRPARCATRCCGTPRRSGRAGRGLGRSDPDGSVRLSGRDFEVGETERRTSAAVCLLVDLSYSMALRGTWGAAKQTALALHALVAHAGSRRTPSRSSGSPTTPGNCARPSWPGWAGTWSRAPTCTTR